MDERQQQLLAQIDAAFAGVELGDGVSIHETQVIDSYGTCEQRLAARTPDEKLDWHKLIDDPDLPWLFGNAGGLSFIDHEGLRFYLPACLSLGVRDPVSADRDDMLHLLLEHYIGRRMHRSGFLATLTDEQQTCWQDVFAYLHQVYVIENRYLD